MKILAICGSHRKGNSYSVLSKISEHYPHIDYELLMLKDTNLEDCRGCYTCVLRGEQFCPLKDDRDLVIQKMLDADGVVFQSPVYVNNISSLMKSFMERFGYVSHRPLFFGKPAIVMAVCGGFGADEANQYMDDIFSSFGFNIVASPELKVATKSDNENSYNLQLTSQAFDSLISKIENGKIDPPSMRQLVMFYIFKMLSESQKDYYVADYEYYKDKPEFPYDRNIGFLKTKMAKQAASSSVKDMMKNR
ncbi:MAG: NAD(P)H-dependent oxidoreductase [Candidatus Thorarchaeota archaeon]